MVQLCPAQGQLYLFLILLPLPGHQLSIGYIFMVRYLVQHRDIFTFV